MPDPTAKADPGELTTEQLIRQLVEETRRLVEGEARLAREQMARSAKHGITAIVILAIGAVLGFTGFTVLCWDVVYLLALVMPLWVSMLVVGGAALTIGGLLALGASSELKKAKGSSREWLENLKENAQWTRKTIHSVARASRSGRFATR